MKKQAMIGAAALLSAVMMMYPAGWTEAATGQAGRSVPAVEVRKPAAEEQAFTVRWKNVSGVTGYQVSCSTEKDFSADAFSVKVKGAGRYSVRIRRAMTEGVIYYVRVRAFRRTGGTTVMGQWSDAAAAEYQPNGKTIVIDPGHQLHANSAKEPIGPGASVRKKKVSSGTAGKWSHLTEAKLNLSASLRLRDELISRGYRVIMTRTKQNVNLSNKDRAEIANRAHADAFLRIHANGSDNSSKRGAFTICQTKKNRYTRLYSKSYTLARDVIQGIGRSTGKKTRGVWKTDTMSGINWSKVPVTIVEMGFMSNRTEDLLLADGHHQDKIAEGIADGVDQYFGRESS